MSEKNEIAPLRSLDGVRQFLQIGYLCDRNKGRK